MNIAQKAVATAKKAMDSYNKAYSKSNEAYFKTKAGKKAKAVLETGGGM